MAMITKPIDTACKDHMSEIQACTLPCSCQRLAGIYVMLWHMYLHRDRIAAPRM